jgi:hypothetical protein
MSNLHWCWINEQHLNIDKIFDHQMSLSKSKCWYSNNCLHFVKRAVPLVTVAGIFCQWKCVKTPNGQILSLSNAHNKVLGEYSSSLAVVASCWDPPCLAKVTRKMNWAWLHWVRLTRNSTNSGSTCECTLKLTAGWPDWAIFCQLGYFWRLIMIFFERM